MGRKKQNFEDSDFGPSVFLAPPSRPSLAIMKSEEYARLKEDAIDRLGTKLDEASDIVDELYQIEGRGVGISDCHEIEDLVDCMARLQSSMRALKEAK